MKLDVKTFVLDCTEDEQAAKVLEEAAEVFGAWQSLDRNYVRINDARPIARVICLDLADEIADVIQAACNLAERYGCFEQVATCHMELANVGFLGSKCDSKTMAVAVLQKANLVYAHWWRCADMAGKSLTEEEQKRLANRVDGLIMYALALAERYGIDVPAALVRCEKRNRARGRYDAGGRQ